MPLIAIAPNLSPCVYLVEEVNIMDHSMNNTIAKALNSNTNARGYLDVECGMKDKLFPVISSIIMTALLFFITDVAVLKLCLAIVYLQFVEMQITIGNTRKRLLALRSLFPRSEVEARLANHMRVQVDEAAGSA